ncbi:MAG: glycosyl transferase family protein [Erythrobacter sp.]
MSFLQKELLIFAVFFFLIGSIDDLLVDLYWFWFRLTGKICTPKIETGEWAGKPLTGDAALFIAAWNESLVIGDTIKHTLAAWPQERLRLYIGCYRNDPDTIEAVVAASGGDSRIRLVIHDCMGPSTKADCLNRLYAALQADEQRNGQMARMVVFHDAEDMVDPAALTLLDAGVTRADFVQLPVLALPQKDSRWLGSHYCEEFAESHAKAMTFRGALGAALPGTGVGCAIRRSALFAMAAERGAQTDSGGPFNAKALTEDYEMGLGLGRFQANSTFIRRRHRNGELVATRAFFPSRLDHIVKQKTRWLHGIAFQGWDRLGWRSGEAIKPAELWMRLRDRRGPLSALVLLAGYLLLALSAISWGGSLMGKAEPLQISPLLQWLLWANLAAFIWRLIMRYAFTAREFGRAEGLRAVMRVPVANIIAIMAGRRAVTAYIASLFGGEAKWEKTPHFNHPARLPADLPSLDQESLIMTDKSAAGWRSS